MRRDPVSGERIDLRAYKVIRGGRGFGDALYVRPIAEHLLNEGYRVAVLTDYPGVFRGTAAHILPFNRNGANVIAHYVHGKRNIYTTQWQDVCSSAELNVLLRINWTVIESSLLRTVRAKAEGRPVVLVNGGREPFNRHDGFGLDLLPQKRAFDAAVSELHDCFTVRIGKGLEKYRIECDLDLSNATGVADVLDLASICSGVVGQCSFAAPLAQVFDKPLLLVWSSKVEQAKHEFVRLLTPRKVLCNSADSWVLDTENDEKLREAARGFRALF